MERKTRWSGTRRVVALAAIACAGLGTLLGMRAAFASAEPPAVRVVIRSTFAWGIAPARASDRWHGPRAIAATDPWPRPGLAAAPAVEPVTLDEPVERLRRERPIDAVDPWTSEPIVRTTPSLRATGLGEAARER